MAIDTITSVDVKTLPPFKRFIMTIGALPTSYLESMTYAELVMWFCNFLQEKVIPAVNNNADAIKEIQDFLNTLDLQDEVDHKLDEMAESGQLQEMIASYLNSKAVFGFDTVADMADAENLIDGSFAETMGYHAKNDGGSALYRIRPITNEDVIDNMLIIAITNSDNLIAELITNKNNLVTCGGKPDDNTFDNSLIVTKMLNAGITNIDVPKGRYYFATTITAVAYLQINGNDSRFDYTGTGYFIDHDVSTEIAYVKLNNIRIYGTTSANCLRIKYITESSFENLRIDTFGVGIYTYYAWDNLFKKVRCQNCNQAFELASQTNNTLFENCAFAVSNTANKATNAEGIEFNSCDFTDITSSTALTGYSSSLSFINCYYEDITNWFLSVSDSGACVINIIGGKCSDSVLKIVPGKSYLHYTTLQHGRVKVLGRNTTSDNPAVSSSLANLDMPNYCYYTQYNTPSYFVGTADVTYIATGDYVTQAFENGQKTFISDSASAKGFFITGLTVGEYYILILEGNSSDADNKNLTFQFNNNSVPDTSGLYSVSINFSGNKLYLPFRAMHGSIRISWGHTSKMYFSKIICVPA